MRRLFEFFARKLRLSNPWRYKAPALMACTYIPMVLGKMPFLDGLLAFAMSCVTIIGIAGIGYLLNDYSDREEDRRAGKRNALQNLDMATIILIFAAVATIAALPWLFYFPVDSLSLGLLAGEIAAFALYALPPFRLKERGVAGVLADAAYAHVLPALLAFHTFALLVGIGTGWMVMFGLLGAWQFFWGIRNILLHQEGDLEKDIRTGTRTLGTQLGKAKLRDLLIWAVILEVIAFDAWLGELMWVWWWAAVVAIAFAVELFYFRLVAWKIGLPTTLRERLSTYLDAFYNAWMPFIPLIALVMLDIRYLALVGLHCLLFPNGLFRSLRNIGGQLGWVK